MNRLPPSLLMVVATFLFATMGVCVKLASEFYDAGEIVMYRGCIGVLMMGLLCLMRGQTLRTRVPAMHFWRSLSGVLALSLWFYAIGKLPLATAMTLNYMSSVWMALFLIGGAVMVGAARIDWRLIAAVLLGFAGVALVLRPTLDQQQLWHGLAGLLSGILSALAYLQVTALGRAGEPEDRVVFYFSVGGVTAGVLSTVALALTGNGQAHSHTFKGAVLLLAVGLLATTAQLLMTRAYARGTTLVNACLQYLGIVFAVAYGALLFRDPITPMALSGIALIITAGLAATLLRAAVIPKDRPHSINES